MRSNEIESDAIVSRVIPTPPAHLIRSHLASSYQSRFESTSAPFGGISQPKDRLYGLEAVIGAMQFAELVPKLLEKHKAIDWILSKCASLMLPTERRLLWPTTDKLRGSIGGAVFSLEMRSLQPELALKALSELQCSCGAGSELAVVCLLTLQFAFDRHSQLSEARTCDRQPRQRASNG